MSCITRSLTPSCTTFFFPKGCRVTNSPRSWHATATVVDANGLVELRIAPLLVLELLHCLQHALLHDILAELFVADAVLQNCQAQPHELLDTIANKEILDSFYRAMLPQG